MRHDAELRHRIWHHRRRTNRSTGKPVYSKHPFVSNSHTRHIIRYSSNQEATAR